MPKRLFFILLSIAFIVSCSRQTPYHNSVFVHIKELTYARNPDVLQWQNLYKSIHEVNQKYQFVLGIGQTKQDTLFPLLQNIFNTSHDDSLRHLCIFSMAQIDTQRSTDFFIKYLRDDRLAPHLKRAIISGLGFCANPRSLSFLEDLIRKPALKEAAFYALASLARHGYQDPFFLDSRFDSSRVQPPSAAEAYYFYYVTLNESQIKRLIAWLPQTQGKARVWVLKKLAHLKSFSLSSLIATDSSVALVLKTFLRRQLLPQNHVRYGLLPELFLAQYFPDSVLFRSVQYFTKDSLPAVRLRAFETLVAINKSQALPLLVNRFSELPFTHEKAYICRLIASADPTTGYLLINQNLDKGSSYFKQTLLSALAQTKFPLAIGMLRRFLHVDDPVLITGAYQALKQIHQLRSEDIGFLLQSKHYSIVALVLSDWYGQHNGPSKTVLLQLFKTFHRANQFELQMTIASLLKKQGRLTSAEQDTIRKYVAHPFVRQKIFKLLGIPFKPKPYNLKVLPAYLRPDSLQKTNHPRVVVKTSKGSFELDFFPEYAPLTVQNFLHLAQKKFYNRLFFHRVIPDFVAQGGDPTGTGWGGPNYLIPSEHAPFSFVRGTVGMATAGFDTGGSQFFICLTPQKHLNGHYTVFAKVVKGMQVVEKLEQGDFILSIERIR